MYRWRGLRGLPGTGVVSEIHFLVQQICIWDAEVGIMYNKKQSNTSVVCFSSSQCVSFQVYTIRVFYSWVDTAYTRYLRNFFNKIKMVPIYAVFLKEVVEPVFYSIS